MTEDLKEAGSDLLSLSSCVCVCVFYSATCLFFSHSRGMYCMEFPLEVFSQFVFFHGILTLSLTFVFKKYLFTKTDICKWLLICN